MQSQLAVQAAQNDAVAVDVLQRGFLPRPKRDFSVLWSVVDQVPGR
jgi:hypothetical protein